MWFHGATGRLGLTLLITVGQKLSFYQILAPLGAGAMGAVWRARDTRLAREVAIKVLPEEFAAGQERLRRFEREARVLATLNHPNVAQIHGVDQVGDTCFLVLELVPGQTLEERLRRGALPLDEALDVCRQIAEGLEAAHETGVIHRDLKPANVRITPQGLVKVLDFGLAKPMRAGVDAKSTDSVLSTEQGRLIGTPAYMAPEQARGRSIDRRVDVWAFGCVLFECLTGKRIFDGESLGDVLASVLEHEPDWTALPGGTPARVREVLRRCLAKDARVRLRDIGEARVALEAPHDPSGSASREPVSDRRWMWIAALASAAGLAAALWAVRTSRSGSASAAALPVTRVGIAIPHADVIAPVVGTLVLTLSPDGRTVAYCAQRDGVPQLFLRRLDEREPTLVAGSANAHNPFFSPDGQWIAFFAAEQLKKASVRGGDPLDLCAATASRSGVWLEDGSIVLSPSQAAPLHRISSVGGELVPLTQLDASRRERTHRWPSALPGGEWVLFVAGTLDLPADYARAQVCAVSVRTGERRDVFAGASMAKYSPSGHLLLGRPGEIFAAPFDLASLRVTGSELPVVDGVLSEKTTGAVHFDLSREGTLAYVSEVPGFDASELVWIDRAGAVEPLPVPAQAYRYPRLSPDEKQVLVSIGEATTGGDVWLLDLERAAFNRLTYEQHRVLPQWSPSGAEIAYGNNLHAFRLEVRALAQDAVPRSIAVGEDLISYPTGWHPDGSGIFFFYFGNPKSDIQFIAVDGATPPRAIAPDDSAQWGAVMSPDGRWLAFVSNESGEDEVFVRSWSRPAAKWQVSRSGGTKPVWARDGKELFYTRGRKLLSVAVDLRGPDFSAGPARELFELPVTRGAPKELTNYDVSGDGQRFLTTRIADERAEIEHIDLVLSWSEELRRLVPTGD